MSRTRRGTSAALAALALTLAVPAIAAAATKPGATTLGASKVTITTATLTGQVNPHGSPTTVYFQYGTTTAYGSRTPNVGVGAGTAAVGAAAARQPRAEHQVPLPPRRQQQRRHHGQRRSRSPRPAALGLVLAPRRTRSPSRSSTLAGTLGHRQRQAPDPATASRLHGAFANVGNAQLTNPQGGFSFALLSVPLTTQYRVLVTDQKSVVSPIVTVSVAVVVGTKTTRRTSTAAATSPARCTPAWPTSRSPSRSSTPRTTG
jgi:hypothetical protein